MLESLRKRQFEIGCVEVNCRNFKRIGFRLEIRFKPINFLYPALISESVGKGVVQQAASKVDGNMNVVIKFYDFNELSNDCKVDSAKRVAPLL